jgi:hypothetical protein
VCVLDQICTRLISSPHQSAVLAAMERELSVLRAMPRLSSAQGLELSVDIAMVGFAVHRGSLLCCFYCELLTHFVLNNA